MDVRGCVSKFVQWSKVDGLFRNVSTTLENIDERCNCPRCKGSGLLIHPTPWKWKQLPSNKKPCWFCEGIGVLPIIGLNGFIVARAPSILQIEDMKTDDLSSPIQMQHNLCTYPATVCKFNMYKPCEEPAELSHDFMRVPAWLSANSQHSSISTKIQGASSLVSIKYKSIFKSLLHSKLGLRSSNDRPPSISRSFEAKQQRRFFSEGLDTGANNVVTSPSLHNFRLGSMRGLFVNPKKEFPKNKLESFTCNKIDNTSGQPSVRCKNCKTLMQQNTPANLHACCLGISQVFGTSHAYDANGSKESTAKGIVQAKTLSKSDRPLLSTRKKPRSFRRERNRVREKAEREAAERTQRNQVSSAPFVNKPTSVVADRKKESIWWLRNQSWKQALSGIFGDKSLVKCFGSSQGATSGQILLPDNIWTIQNIYSRIKENSLLSPPPLKS